MKIDLNDLIKEINNVTKSLFRTKSVTQYKYYKETLLFLKSIYYILTGIEYKAYIPNNPYYEKFLRSKNDSLTTNIIEFYSNINLYNEITNNILKCYDNNNFYDLCKENEQRRIKERDYFELINEFLLSYDEKLLNFFEHIKKNNQIDMVTDKIKSNLTYGIIINNHLNKSYVLVDNKYTIANASTFIHELGHAYSYYMISNRSLSQSYNFNLSYEEFISDYFEFLFLKYLYKNHIYINDAIKCENCYYVYLKEYIKELNLYTIINIDNLSEYDLFDINNDFNYGIGCYLSLFMHDKYEKSKEEAINRLNDYMCYQGLIDRDEQLEILGINREDFLNTDILSKHLENHVKSLYKKKN